MHGGFQIDAYCSFSDFDTRHVFNLVSNKFLPLGHVHDAVRNFLCLQNLHLPCALTQIPTFEHVRESF
jgi:hypothetical protein